MRNHKKLRIYLRRLRSKQQQQKQQQKQQASKNKTIDPKYKRIELNQVDYMGLKWAEDFNEQMHIHIYLYIYIHSLEHSRPIVESAASN